MIRIAFHRFRNAQAALARRRCGSQDGSVVVEFALIATIMMFLLAAIVDISLMAMTSREMERASTQVAAVLTSCPDTDATCVRNFIDQYRDRKVNTLLQYPNAVVSIAQVNKINGVMRICIGNVTYLDADVSTSASKVFSENDEGFIVMIQMQYRPLIPFYTNTIVKPSGSYYNYRSWTSAVRTSDGKPYCQTS